MKFVGVFGCLSLFVLAGCQCGGAARGPGEWKGSGVLFGRTISHMESGLAEKESRPRPTSNVRPVSYSEATTDSRAPAEAACLSLFDAVEVGLAQNSDLETLRRAEGVSVAALGVARTYPFNPYVQVQVTPSESNPNFDPRVTGHYVLLMQTLQLAHQQRHREDAALTALAGVRWNILQAELQNIAQTQRLFGTALYQRGLRDLAHRLAERNDELLATSQRQFDAGQIAAVDVAIVRLDAQATRRQARLADANYHTALLDLRRQLNLPLSAPLELSGQLSDWQWLPASCEQLLDGREPRDACVTESATDRAASLAAGRPDVMAARADLAAARAGENLARANRIPDLQIGPYYQHSDSDTTFWGLRAQTDIPVWNNGRPLVRQRLAEVRQRHAAWEQLLARATLEAEAALDRYARARRLVSEDPASDELPEELQRLEAQFQAGEVDLLRVFTARASLLQLRRARLDSLNELAQAAAAVTAATGLPPQQLIDAPN